MIINAKNFILAMARAKLGAGELSNKSCIGKNTIYLICKGGYKTTPRTAGRLAEALGVDVTEIIES
ncbi:helix-turn-helix domain-containing protein [Anaerotignum sp.]